MRFVVSGYYGCGNVGDEAVLAGIRTAFARQAGNRVELVALSQDPVATAAQHQMRAVYRMNLSSVRQALRESDLLLSGGGSLLQDTTSMRSLLYYLWVARMAHSLGIPVMFYAQGIGPLRRAMSRTLVRMVANRAAYITVRDTKSAQLLRSLGVTFPNIEVTADPAFALSVADPAEVATLYAAENLPLTEPMIGVALRPWGKTGESPVEEYAKLLPALEKQCHARVVLLPMHHPEDVEFAETVAQHTGCPEAFPLVRGVYTPEVLLGLIARMQAVVAMRLHALIFAARVAVPLYALSYDPKVESLMRQLGLTDSLDSWRGLEPEKTAGNVAALLRDRQQRIATLRAQSEELEHRALCNAERALSVALHRELLPSGD